VTPPRHPRVQLPKLLAARAQADDRIGSRADILGSMIGLKLVVGASTRRTGITYLVREKIPETELSPGKRIPRRLTIGGQRVTTDVIVWPHMVNQGLESADSLSDGVEKGTLTCFARHPLLGDLGIACGHCLLGTDGNAATPTSIRMRSSGGWEMAGNTLYVIFSPGASTSTGSFGYLDCGLFTLDDITLQVRAKNAKPLPMVTDDQSLWGERVRARSGFDSLGVASPSRDRSAVVFGLFAVALGYRYDFVLHADGMGTFPGDSGMLWMTAEGKAAILHTNGELMPEHASSGSLVVTGMSARRAADLLGVSLLAAR